MLCVGLDPDPAKIPAHLQGPDAIFRFCADIADATASLACAFKPQIAYFAAIGAEAQLEKLCEHIRVTHPQVVLILDAKRGDIGPTAERYAHEAFVRYGADAVTVNPYLGTDSLEPFLAHIRALCQGGGRAIEDHFAMAHDQDPV
jgi:orotidine-5'-phosphate decarboxylase